jgi:hypothetical protein
LSSLFTSAFLALPISIFSKIANPQYA